MSLRTGTLGLLVALAGLPACVRYIGADPTRDASPAETGNLSDVAIGDVAAKDSVIGLDTTLPKCGSQIELGKPVRVPGVNSISDDWAPALSADGLTIIFSSWRAGGPGNEDLWQSSRASPQAPFAQPVPIAELNTSSAEGGASLTADGLVLCFSSSRAGGLGSYDLYQATRPDRGSPFGPPQHLTEISSPQFDASCGLSADGLTVVFQSTRSGGGGSHDLWRASRAGVDMPFGQPTPITELNTADREGQPFLSEDGLAIFFESDRPGGAGQSDLYVARRDKPTEPFGPAVNLSSINTANDDGHPSIPGDGTTLFVNLDTKFSGDPQLKADIWQVQLLCRP
jgi:Tol biopolymer transport system component